MGMFDINSGSVNRLANEKYIYQNILIGVYSYLSLEFDTFVYWISWSCPFSQALMVIKWFETKRITQPQNNDVEITAIQYSKSSILDKVWS